MLTHTRENSTFPFAIKFKEGEGGYVPRVVPSVEDAVTNYDPNDHKTLGPGWSNGRPPLVFLTAQTVKLSYIGSIFF